MDERDFLHEALVLSDAAILGPLAFEKRPNIWLL